MLIDHQTLTLAIEDIKHVLEIHGNKIELIFEYFDELLEKKDESRTVIGFRLKGMEGGN